MCASNSHSYTHLIQALGIVRKPTVWVFITSKYPGTHDIGLPNIMAWHAPVLCCNPRDMYIHVGQGCTGADAQYVGQELLSQLTCVANLKLVCGRHRVQHVMPFIEAFDAEKNQGAVKSSSRTADLING